MRMIDDSGLDIFDAILIYDSSRFARNLKESLIYKAGLKKNGVSLISITEPNLDDDSALLVDALLGASNELYSRKLSKNVLRGMVYSAERGNIPTSPPYGYRKANGAVVIDEEESVFIRKVFELFMAKPSPFITAHAVNEQGYRTRRGLPWTGSGISRIIGNPTYTGVVRFHGELYKGSHDPIIDSETWQKAQALIAPKASRRRSRPESYAKHWMSGAARCYHCDRSMVSASYILRGKRRNSFRCCGYQAGVCKHINYITWKTLEDAVTNMLKAILDAPGADDVQIETVKPAADRSGDLAQKLKSVKARLSRHKEAYAAGVDTLAEYKANREKCESEIKAIESQIMEMRDDELTDERFERLQLRISDMVPSRLFRCERRG